VEGTWRGRRLNDVLCLVALVRPLALDTLAASAARGVAGSDEQERLRLSLVFAAFERLMPQSRSRLEHHREPRSEGKLTTSPRSGHPCEHRFVSGTWEPEVVTAIRTALEGCSAVTSVTLGGSRERGGATELSDWDLYLVGDRVAMMVEVPAIIASFRPLAAFWEPLAEEAGYMVVLDGPTKVDVFPAGGRRRRIQPPWVVSAETLAQIDGHFWDWILWLGGKTLRDERELVTSELIKMHGFLLEPMGVAAPPTSLDEARATYLCARASAMDDLGVVVDPELERQVSNALQRHGVIT
jgi:predicted nucleotidyltransferase